MEGKEIREIFIPFKLKKTAQILLISMLRTCSCVPTGVMLTFSYLVVWDFPSPPCTPAQIHQRSLVVGPTAACGKVLTHAA